MEGIHQKVFLDLDRFIKRNGWILLFLACFLVSAYFMRSYLDIFSRDTGTEVLKLNDVNANISSSETNIIKNFTFFLSEISLKEIIKFPFKYIDFIFPVSVITTFELITKRKNLRERLTNTSLGKMVNSEEKYADIWYFFLYTFVQKIPFIVGLLTFGLSTFSVSANSWFDSLIKQYIVLPSSILGSTLLFIFGILFSDFWFYFDHRISHMNQFLWDFHELHHSATEMNILNGKRFSLLDGLIPKIVLAPFYFSFSAFAGFAISHYLSIGNFIPFIMSIIWGTLGQISNIAGHSSFKIIYPKPFSLFLLSPALHWIHHSNNVKHYDKNFGGVFCIWDKLFGTYLDETHLKDITSFGVTNTDYNKYHPLYSWGILPIVKFTKRFSKVFV
ncbi:sterol desaturase family protein [uncultured Prochlorococcus sp.]|uniref:sterol desaturase family protein n=1 Tax=uncultured Prochlorococcus sp. TaxID=159733 RepID=UPI00258433CD|nr:sterol desaturase family protein [uncultured Prochlorococcus sp.]